MSLDDSNNSMWLIFEKINSLRNEIAHSLNSAKVNKIILDIKKLYNKEMEPGNYKWDEDVSGMKSVFAFCLGFLTSFYDEVGRFKRVVKLMDFSYNKHHYVEK